MTESNKRSIRRMDIDTDIVLSVCNGESVKSISTNSKHPYGYLCNKISINALKLQMVSRYLGVKNLEIRTVSIGDIKNNPIYYKMLIDNYYTAKALASEVPTIQSLEQRNQYLKDVFTTVLKTI